MTKTDYLELSRRSMRKDFYKANFKRNGRVPRIPHPLNTKRILAINESCTYWPFRKYLVGKLVRLIGKGYCGGVWVEFVKDADRREMNKNAGWPEEKKEYLLMGAKFDD